VIATYLWASAEEYALAFNKARDLRLLIVPALFEEASRMRRLTVEVMRRLDLAGIDCFLPDLPGCNESLVPLETLTPEDWRSAIAAAANHFRATHVLGIRGGALLTPPGMPGWHYAPAKGASLLRQMIRARILTSREAGINETQDALMAQGMQSGLELAGYRLSAEFLTQLQSLVADSSSVIEQEMIGGGGLWLRAEPDEDRHQADALAAILAIGMKA
jgi:pimeloyl-ACP methyl ester carboxylesterase